MFKNVLDDEYWSDYKMWEKLVTASFNILSWLWLREIEKNLRNMRLSTVELLNSSHMLK
jgi:hypothetical protein